MTKTIVIFGAGPGLGLEVARKYGKQGYQVALVARRKDRLEALVAQLKEAGISATAYPGDLSKVNEVPALIAEIRADLGHIDAVYFGPEAGQGFVPAATLSVDLAREKVDLLFLSFVAIINAVLPEMRTRKSGEILAGFGGSAAHGIPFLSGPGPALAATRNLIYALHGELAIEGIYAGLLTITAVIRNSDTHTAIASGAIKLDLPPGFEVPDADPEHLANLLWQASQTRDVPELVYPPQAH